MVGQPDQPRLLGGALAVCASANTGDGRRHGRQAVHGSDLGLDRVWPVTVAKYKVKSAASPRPYFTDSYYFHSVRDAFGGVVRVCRGTKNCGAGKFALVAQRWQRDVCAAVAVRRGDILEVKRKKIGNLIGSG